MGFTQRGELDGAESLSILALVILMANSQSQRPGAWYTNRLRSGLIMVREKNDGRMRW